MEQISECHPLWWQSFTVCTIYLPRRMHPVAVANIYHENSRANWFVICLQMISPSPLAIGTDIFKYRRAKQAECSSHPVLTLLLGIIAPFETLMTSSTINIKGIQKLSWMSSSSGSSFIDDSWLVGFSSDTTKDTLWTLWQVGSHSGARHVTVGTSFGGVMLCINLSFRVGEVISNVLVRFVKACWRCPTRLRSWLLGLKLSYCAHS